MEDYKVDKLTLKPVETELKRIREELKSLISAAKPAKKKTLHGQAKKLDKLISMIVITCKRHTIG
jgi:hypothetical protein